MVLGIPCYLIGIGGFYRFQMKTLIFRWFVPSYF